MKIKLSDCIWAVLIGAVFLYCAFYVGASLYIMYGVLESR